MLELLKHRVQRGGFVRNSFILTAGTTIAQGIAILSSPILTRLFSPNEFGILATLVSITTIMNVVATGKYESVILIAKTDRDAINIVVLALSLSLLVSILSTFLILVLPTGTLSFFVEGKVLLFICPLASLMMSIYQCYNEWCVRKKYFNNLSLNKIVNTFSIALFSVILGIFSIGWGLILGDLIGRIFSSLSCFLSFVRKDIKQLFLISFVRIFYLAKQYADCPKFFMPGQLFNVLGGQLPIFILGAFFGEKEVGFYAITCTALSVPVSVVSVAIRDVFRQKANEEYRKHNNCFHLFKQTTIYTFLFSVVTFGTLYCVMPFLFSFVFGEEWGTAGVYAQILLPMVALNFVSESVSGVFIVANKLKLAFIWQVLYLSTTFVSLIIGVYVFKMILPALMCFMIGRCLIFILQIAMSYKISKGSVND